MNGALRSVDFKVPMVFKEILVFEFDYILEHGAVLHVVAVNWVVPAAEVRLAVGIQIDGAIHAVVPFKIFVEVILVIRGLDDRIVDLSVRHADPADGVRVRFQKRCKING